MLEYTIQKVELRNKKAHKVCSIIRFKDQAYNLLADFVETDGMMFYEELLAKTQQVTDSGEEFTFNGNRCQAALFPGMVIIYDRMAEDEIGDWCQVSMQEFLDLLQNYHQSMHTESKENPEE